jgi:signal transduction histidine kinase
VVTGHEDTLRLLLTALVDNAIKYTDRRNVGIGVGRDVQPDAGDRDALTARVCHRMSRHGICLPFERGAAADERGAAGSGLGRYLAQRLATRRDTRLALRRTPSVGTTCAVQLNQR